MKTLQDYIRSQRYLYPRILNPKHHLNSRLFQLIHHWAGLPKEDEYLANYSSTQANCYVVDYFLRFMATHGYTLQKTQASVDEFLDLEESVEQWDQEQRQRFYDAIKTRLHQ